MIRCTHGKTDRPAGQLAEILMREADALHACTPDSRIRVWAGPVLLATELLAYDDDESTMFVSMSHPHVIAIFAEDRDDAHRLVTSALQSRTVNPVKVFLWDGDEIREQSVDLPDGIDGQDLTDLAALRFADAEGHGMTLPRIRRTNVREGVHVMSWTERIPVESHRRPSLPRFRELQMMLTVAPGNDAAARKLIEDVRKALDVTGDG